MKFCVSVFLENPPKKTQVSLKPDENYGYFK